ncbi:hypothetical protein ACIO1C_31110 [Streptomyces sp. NPDC087420]|uniref:hypothetical protein n=1 Tax=Streptomyces sp. NPDC087420 TaxID=3365785 RepID=UPI003834A439
MTHPTPPPGHIAPHIPADLYRRAEATGRPIVIVHTTTPPPNRPAHGYLIPIVVATTGAIGLLGTVAAILALIEFAAHTTAIVASTAGPIGIGGITLKLARSKAK